MHVLYLSDEDCEDSVSPPPSDSRHHKDLIIVDDEENNIVKRKAPSIYGSFIKKKYMQTTLAITYFLTLFIFQKVSIYM